MQKSKDGLTNLLKENDLIRIFFLNMRSNWMLTTQVSASLTFSAFIKRVIPYLCCIDPRSHWTQWLGFEYHTVGAWGEDNLIEAIDLLSEYNFVGYQAGKHKLWRIIGWWMDQFNDHTSSNVASVNYNLYQSRDLAGRVEQVFRDRKLLKGAIVVSSKSKGQQASVHISVYWWALCCLDAFAKENRDRSFAL